MRGVTWCPFTHALTCPQLSEYWTKISEALLSAYDATITPKPCMPIVGVPLSNSSRLGFHLLALTLSIMKWKHVSPPKSVDWIKEAVNCIKLEKIRYSTKSSIKLFIQPYTTWKPFLDHIKSSTLVPDSEEAVEGYEFVFL